MEEGEERNYRGVCEEEEGVGKGNGTREQGEIKKTIDMEAWKMRR